MVWINIMKTLGIASFKSIYPKILTRLVGSEGFVLPINFISISLIKPLWPAVWKWAKKPTCLWYSTLRIFRLLSLWSFPLYLNSPLVWLLQTRRFVTTCKYMIDFVNLLVKTRLKCISFYNIFANLATIFVAFSWPSKSLSHWINFNPNKVAPKSSHTAKWNKECRVK